MYLSCDPNNHCFKLAAFFLSLGGIIEISILSFPSDAIVFVCLFTCLVIIAVLLQVSTIRITDIVGFANNIIKDQHGTNNQCFKVAAFFLLLGVILEIGLYGITCGIMKGYAEMNAKYPPRSKCVVNPPLHPNHIFENLNVDTMEFEKSNFDIMEFDPDNWAVARGS